MSFLMILFILCSTHLTAQTDYYYYNGNKIPLTMNNDKVCVSIPIDFEGTRERILENVTVLDKIYDDIFDIFIILRSDFESLTSLDFWEEDKKSVILTPSYYTADGHEVIATPYINVRLKKEQDIDLLTSYAEKYGLRIVRQASSLMPLWYIVAVTKDCDKNPLECANLLWESGEFASSQPDLCALGDVSIVIFNVTGNNLTESPVFDLQGRRLNGAPQKGFYIKNGRKYVK